MKRILTILFASAVLFSCQKVAPEISDHPFKITAQYIATSSVNLDILPENNDFYWYFDVVSVSDFNAKGTIEACIAETDKVLKKQYQEAVEEGYADKPFCETMLYRGSYLVTGAPLKEKENYVAYAFMYNDDGSLSNKYQTFKFSTYEFIPSDIKFELSLKGSELTISPSNNDCYFWLYNYKKFFDEEWGGHPLTYYYYGVAQIIQYEFFDFLEISGQYTEDISDYYTVKDGDTFTLFISGYNHDINSTIYTYELTYAGEGKEGSVVLVGEDPL